MSLHSSDVNLKLRVGPQFGSYRKKDVNPLSGVVKYRTIHAPNAAMRKIQALLLRELRALNPHLPFAVACVPGASILGHVRPHVGNQHVVQYDLENAYAAVRADRLQSVLESFGYRGRWIASAATRYSMHTGGGLILGAASSQDLFNIYVDALVDQRLAPLLKEWGDVTYTRYLDDLVFSSSSRIGRRRRSQILEVIREADFQLSQTKTRISDLAVDAHVVINGVGVRITGELFVSKTYRRFLFDLLKGASVGEVNPQRLAGHMGAFYATVGSVARLQGPQLRIHRMYQQQLEIWRQLPERQYRRNERRRRYRANLSPHQRRKQRLALRRRRQRQHFP